MSMSKVRIPRLKFVVFALVPMFALLVAAETAVRVKFFIAHDYEWPYLTTPIGRQHFAPANKEDVFKRPDAVPASSPSAPAAGAAASAAAARARAPGGGAAAGGPAHDDDGAGGVTAASNPQQMVFKWAKPCGDTMVYSAELQKQMPRTFDDNCFRGDRVAQVKPPDEYRIVFLGGSTVEDFQSDAEMMTNQFKQAMPPTRHGRRVTVVNAGRVTFESRRIARYYRQSVWQFTPDLAVYYEAWNEQPRDAKWTRVDDRLGQLRSQLHTTLYYKSMLYTYLIEKFAFMTTSDDYFWKIDSGLLRSGFATLVENVRFRSHTRLVFVTQVVQFPRMWKGVDTFDYRAVDALLDRLRADPKYDYSVNEISALNQRLAVGFTIELCRELDVPVVNILDGVEALGDSGRAEMFMDLGHLTVKGDKIVGELIASRMVWPE